MSKVGGKDGQAGDWQQKEPEDTLGEAFEDGWGADGRAEACLLQPVSIAKARASPPKGSHWA